MNPFLNHPASTRRRGWDRPTWRLHPGIAIAIVTAVAVGWILRGVG